VATTISEMSPTSATAVAGRMIRAWPYRSTKRASWGPQSALAITYAAETLPAREYESNIAESISTMPIPTIEIGSRASTPVSEKASAPGFVRMSR